MYKIIYFFTINYKIVNIYTLYTNERADEVKSRVVWSWIV